jgi:RNA polymerase sigma-70 factor, ECF subfamily
MSDVSSLLRAVRLVREPLDVASIYDAHGDAIHASLARLGVREPDRQDAMQDVLVVVHRRLGSWDGECKITSWLFGICIRVAAKYRRRAHVRHESSCEEACSARASDETSPEDAVVERDARARLERVLDGMDLTRRAVLVMYELEELSTREITEQLGVPVGTIHSRLYAARKEFEDSLARLEARAAHAARVARRSAR